MSGNSRCLIVAEIGNTHEGSLGLAHAFVDAVANTGADAIKFQAHIASAESTPGEPFRVPFSYEDPSRYEYWQRMEFTEEQWRGLADHSREASLKFIVSPFSLEATYMLDRVGLDVWKVGSGEIGTVQMLKFMANSGTPMIVSTGMSPYAEIGETVDLLRGWGGDFTLMQCTTAYPCPPERVGLNAIGELKSRYNCPVGLSDHSGSIFPGLAAATVGIAALEVHVTLSPEMFGPDVAASVTTAELKQLVDGVRYIETIVNNPVDKDEVAKEMTPLRQIFFKSVAASRDLAEGTVLTADDLTLKKPGTGIPPRSLESLVGKALAKSLERNQVLTEEDLA